MAGFPPGSKNQIQQKQNAYHACWTYPHAQQQTHSDQHLDHADHVSEEDGMRQDHAGQQRAIKTQRSSSDVVAKISLKASVRESRPCQLVLAEQEKEDGCG